MGDHDQAALVAGQEAAQPGDRVGVEVVRGLVEQQDAAAGRGRVPEQDPGQLDPATLAAGERAERLGEDAVRQAEVRADPGGLGLGRVAAEPGELVFQRAVPPQRLVVRVGRHPRFERLHLAQQRVQAAGGQHPVRGGDVEVAGTRVLRQVSDRSAAVHRAAVRLALAREDLERRGLAGAVAADQADPVTRLHAQGGFGQQDAGAGTQFQAVRRDHG